jgi:hypothetical protein
MKGERTMHIPLHSCSISKRQSANMVASADGDLLALTLFAEDTSPRRFQVDEETRWA